MAEATATPRITQPYLEQFSHQTVRILGKVRQLRGEQATIDAGGSINVFLNRVSRSCVRRNNRAGCVLMVVFRTRISNSTTRSKSSGKCRMI